MILLRHGESQFNVAFRETGKDPGIRDPRLTERGRGQAREAARRLEDHGVKRTLASPFTRALETAEALGLPTVIDPMVRENSAFICDIGTPASQLMERWPEHDFSHMDEIWWSPLHTEDKARVRVRAVRFRALALDWPDHHEVVVVSHWGFIRALTGFTVKNCEMVLFDPHSSGNHSQPA